MKKILPLLTAILLAAATNPLQAQDDEMPAGALRGPATGKLGTVAEIEVPTGYMFLDGKLTRAMMKGSGEPTTGKELGFLRPTNGGFAIFFEFDDSGYVKDDDKDKLDAPKLLKSYQDGAAQENKARRSEGKPPLQIVGWLQEPKYDEQTHNLTWAIRATSGGEEFLNYNTRLLGRKGVMEVVLVCDTEDLPKHLPAFNNLLTKYKYESGQSYAEYRPGDKIAKYGLAGLVTAGAFAGAAKLGLLGPVILFFKKGFKFIIMAVVAIAAFLKKLFSRIFGGKNQS